MFFSGGGVEYRRFSFYLFLRFSVLKLKSAASAIGAASNFSCEKMCLLHLLVRHCLQIVIPNNTHLMQSKKWCVSFLETWACEDTHLLESGTWSVPVMCVSGLRYFKLTLPASLLSSHLLSVHYRAALNLIDASQSREANFFQMISVFIMTVSSENQFSQWGWVRQPPWCSALMELLCHMEIPSFGGAWLYRSA